MRSCEVQDIFDHARHARVGARDGRESLLPTRAERLRTGHGVRRDGGRVERISQIVSDDFDEAFPQLVAAFCVAMHGTLSGMIQRLVQADELRGRAGRECHALQVLQHHAAQGSVLHADRFEGDASRQALSGVPIAELQEGATSLGARIFGDDS